MAKRAPPPLTPKQLAREREKQKQKAAQEQADQCISQYISPGLDKRFEELTEIKAKLLAEQSELNAQNIVILRRNNDMLEKLLEESNQYDQRLEKVKKKQQRIKEECDIEIKKKQEEAALDFKKVEAVLIQHKKDRNHLSLELSEKREIEEIWRQMDEQRKKANEEAAEILKEIFRTSDYVERQRSIEAELNEQLEQEKEEAFQQINQESIDTLKEAEAQSHDLTQKVTESQKVVGALRVQYNKLLEETNRLEMQLMEAKLVTQLTTPEQNQNKITKLREEFAKLEDQKIKSRTAPEAEARRLTTQHLNNIKKMKTELSGFRRLNQIKRDEMEQLRNLAKMIVEQHSTAVTYLNDTMSILRKRIASTVDQSTLPFRTTELVLCHVKPNDQDTLGRSFTASDGTASVESEALMYYEVLYSRFTGIDPPRKVDELM